MEPYNTTLARYSLYGDASTWNGNIQEDVEGRWLKWKDTEAYVQYALQHGYTPKVVEESTPKLRQDMVDDKQLVDQQELFDDPSDVDDSTEDLVDLMVNKQASERFDDEV